MASVKAGPSKKLGQTLHELESAFADWEALSDSAPVTAAEAAPLTPSVSRNESKDAELRKKTKKLLDQLRQQLSELAD